MAEPPRSTNKVPLREALICAPEGALGGAEAPLFHGISWSVRAPCEIKIKSSGQECPLHTSRA